MSAEAGVGHGRSRFPLPPGVTPMTKTAPPWYPRWGAVLFLAVIAGGGFA